MHLAECSLAARSDASPSHSSLLGISESRALFAARSGSSEESGDPVNLSTVVGGWIDTNSPCVVLRIEKVSTMSSAWNVVIDGQEGKDEVSGLGVSFSGSDDVLSDVRSELVVKLASISETCSSTWSSVSHGVYLRLVSGMLIGLLGETHVDLEDLSGGVTPWKSLEVRNGFIDSSALLSESESPLSVNSGAAVEIS